VQQKIPIFVQIKIIYIIYTFIYLFIHPKHIWLADLTWLLF